MTSEMTPTLMYVYTHTHTHSSLEVCDLYPPDDPKVHQMLDLMGAGALLSGSMNSEVAGEVITFALQPWLKTSALGPYQKERGMELCPCPSPSLTCQPGLGQGP